MTHKNARLKYGHELLTLLSEPKRKFDLQKAKQLIDLGASLYVRNNLGRTALHIAIDKGHTDAALYLIENDAPLESRGWNDFTTLHNAIAGAHVEIVKSLLLHGASVKKRTNSGHDVYSLLQANASFTHDLEKIEKFKTILKLLNEIPAQMAEKQKRDAFNACVQKITTSQKPLPVKKARFKNNKNLKKNP